jgi:hypothetical protein
LTDAQVNFLANQATVDGTIKNLGLNGDYLVIPVDPIDFTLTGPNGLKVTSSGGAMTTNVPNAFFAGSGANELLIVPNASRGQYQVDLVGLGSGNFLFGASFVSASKDVTTDLVQGNLRGGGTEAILDFQNLAGGVQMVSNVSAPPLATPGGGPGSMPAPGPSTADSNSSSSQGPLATAVNGVILALTTQISGNPGSTTVTPGGVSTASAQGAAGVSSTSTSPAQPVPANARVGQGSNLSEPNSPDGQSDKPRDLEALGSAMMEWMMRVLGLAGEVKSGPRVLQFLLEAARSWLRSPTAVGPQSSINGSPSGEILQHAGVQIDGENSVTTTVDALSRRQPASGANAPGPGEVTAIAGGPPAPASAIFLAMAVAPLHWIYRRPGGQLGRIKRRHRSAPKSP